MTDVVEMPPLDLTQASRDEQAAAQRLASLPPVIDLASQRLHVGVTQVVVAPTVVVPTGTDNGPAPVTAASTATAAVPDHFIIEGSFRSLREVDADRYATKEYVREKTNPKFALIHQKLLDSAFLVKNIIEMKFRDLGMEPPPIHVIDMPTFEMTVWNAFLRPASELCRIPWNYGGGDPSVLRTVYDPFDMMKDRMPLNRPRPQKSIVIVTRSYEDFYRSYTTSLSQESTLISGVPEMDGFDDACTGMVPSALYDNEDDGYERQMMDQFRNDAISAPADMYDKHLFLNTQMTGRDFHPISMTRRNGMGGIQSIEQVADGCGVDLVKIGGTIPHLMSWAYSDGCPNAACVMIVSKNLVRAPEVVNGIEEWVQHRIHPYVEMFEEQFAANYSSMVETALAAERERIARENRAREEEALRRQAQEAEQRRLTLERTKVEREQTFKKALSSFFLSLVNKSREQYEALAARETRLHEELMQVTKARVEAQNMMESGASEGERKLKKEIEDLYTLVPGLYEQFFVKDGKFYGVTSPVVINDSGKKWDAGQYAVIADFGATKVMIHRWNPATHTDSNEPCHPHVNDGRCCLGNIVTECGIALANKEIFAIFFTMRNFLSSINRSSPYRANLPENLNMRRIT